MWKSFGLVNILFLCTALPAVMGACSGSSTRLDENAKLHLVIDAGSSGTRFCLYRIHMNATGSSCSARTPGSPYDRCIKVRAKNGLADLEKQEALRVLESGFARFKAPVRERIVSFALLGTGGFRGKSKRVQEKRMAAFRSHFAGFKPGGSFQVITGAMEGKLAWRTTQLLFAPGGFSILETGGATVQFAVGTKPGDVRSVSAYVGLNLSRSKLKNRASFKHCEAGSGKSPESFRKCRDLIASSIMRNSALARGIRKNPPAGKLFALGAPWSALFRMAGKTDSLSRKSIEDVGRKYCGFSLEQTVAQGIPRKYAPGTCFLIAHQSALLELTGRDTILRGGESWPRGAAVTQDFFSACGD